MSVSPPNPDLSIDEYRALAEFRYRIRLFLRFSEQQARANGLEPQQHQLLLAIKGLPQGTSATVLELSSRMQLRHHSTVELIDRLAAKKLVVRRTSAEDRRQVLVALTRSGENVLRRLSLAHHEELETAGAGFLKALRAVLRTAPKHRTKAA